MTVDQVLAKHPATLAGFIATKLTLLPVRWLPLVDRALSEIEALVPATDLGRLTVDGIYEKYNTLRIDVYIDSEHPRRDELQDLGRAIEEICVSAEDASERQNAAIERLVALVSAEFDARRWVREWIQRPQQALGGRRPDEMLDTEEGLAAVVRVLIATKKGALG